MSDRWLQPMPPPLRQDKAPNSAARTDFRRPDVVFRLLAFVCGCWLMAAAAHGAEEPARTITAGPFSVKTPAAWTEGAMVEKVAIHPQYTPEEWKSYQNVVAASREESLARKKAGEPNVPDLSNLKATPGPASYNVRPEHWAVRFPKLALKGKEYDAKDAGDEPTAPQILIHKAADWGALLDGSRDEKAGREEVQRMRKALKKQDPTVPWWLNTAMGFVFLKKELRFEGGRGFRMLAQDSIEHRILGRGELYYLFIGMSDDDTCQIIASIPVEIPGLPDGDEEHAEHLGFSNSRYPELRRKYPKYRRLAKDWVTENAPKATPSLAELDAMVESLVVKKWE